MMRNGSLVSELYNKKSFYKYGEPLVNNILGIKYYSMQKPRCNLDYEFVSIERADRTFKQTIYGFELTRTMFERVDCLFRVEKIFSNGKKKESDVWFCPEGYEEMSKSNGKSKKKYQLSQKEAEDNKVYEVSFTLSEENPVFEVLTSCNYVRAKIDELCKFRYSFYVNGKKALEWISRVYNKSGKNRVRPDIMKLGQPSVFAIIQTQDFENWNLAPERYSRFYNHYYNKVYDYQNYDLPELEEEIFSDDRETTNNGQIFNERLMGNGFQPDSPGSSSCDSWFSDDNSMDTEEFENRNLDLHYPFGCDQEYHPINFIELLTSD